MESIDEPAAQKLLQAFMQLRRSHWRPGAAAGMTPGEIFVLSCIKDALDGDASGIRVSDLSNLLRVAAPTMTQQISDLELHGYVAKHSDPADRRAVRIRLTDKGEEMVQRGRVAHLASFQGLAAYLGEADSAALAGLLTRAAQYFQETQAVTSEHLSNPRDPAAATQNSRR